MVPLDSEYRYNIHTEPLVNVHHYMIYSIDIYYHVYYVYPLQYQISDNALKELTMSFIFIEKLFHSLVVESIDETVM